MKSLILYLTLSICIISNGYSQQDENVFKDKHGRIVLPQQGDLAVGLSVNPIFDYMGNLFNGSDNNQLALKLLNNNQLFFKYFLAPGRAIRTRVGISKYDQLYTDSNIDADVKESHINFSAFLGYEKRKGRERLQLFYGGETGVDFSTVNYVYKYHYYSPTPRISKASSDSYSGLTLRGFAGVEYFVLPKISFGSEVGISMRLQHFNHTNDNSLEINTDIFNGQIYVLFYFE